MPHRRETSFIPNYVRVKASTKRYNSKKGWMTGNLMYFVLLTFSISSCTHDFGEERKKYLIC